MITVVERARRLMAVCPPAVSGSGGHGATFRVACALVWGFGLSPEEAMPLMLEYNQGCQPPWNMHELWHKLRSVLNTAQRLPRGHLVEGDAERGALPEYVVPKRRVAVSFDLAALKRAQRPDWTVDAAFLRARSPVDPRDVEPGAVLDALYGPEDRLMVFGAMRSRGDWMRWRGRWFELGKTPDQKAREVRRIPDRAREGMIWLVQPVDGTWHAVTGKTQLSRRTLKSVVRFPYLLLESDEAPADLWLNMIARLPLPIVAITESGGRSVHALVRVDCDRLEDWKDTVGAARDTLAALGCDSQALMNPVVNMRLPGVMREGKMMGGGPDQRFVPYSNGPRKQRLLYLAPGAEARVLGEAAVLR